MKPLAAATSVTETPARNGASARCKRTWLRHACGGKPVVWQIVPESQRAWHAGVSYWQGTTELNAVSIGIENINRGPISTPQGPGWQPYPPAQVDALIRLAKDIVTRYAIPPTRVVGHSDIAPGRKSDPGPAFDWPRLRALVA